MVTADATSLVSRTQIILDTLVVMNIMVLRYITVNVVFSVLSKMITSLSCGNHNSDPYTGPGTDPDLVGCCDSFV
jgi:uncharacterized SAM-dependent methyltransferase